MKKTLLTTCSIIWLGGYGLIAGPEHPARPKPAPLSHNPITNTRKVAPVIGQIPPRLLSQIPTLLASGRVDVPVRDMTALFSQLPAGSLANIGGLLSTLGTEPRYVAIGGSLTAGYRNGGLYREAQLTAYPNLIARQMGLANFRQPLFDLAQGNGSGYKKLKPGGSFPQYTDVLNNVAVMRTDPLTFAPFMGRVDNLGMPFLGIHSSHATEEWRSNDQIAPGVPYEPAFRAYFRRFLPDNDQKWLTGFLPYINQQTADLFSIELGLDDAIWYATAGGYRLNGVMTQLAMGEGNPIIELLDQVQRQKSKSIIATVPDVLSFPYFKFYSVKAVRIRNSGKPLYAVVDDRYELVTDEARTQYVAELADTDVLLPTSTVNKLATSADASVGLSPRSPLSNGDVLTVDELNAMKHVDELNSLIRTQAAQYKIPVVDLQAVYNRILAGTYVTHDGINVDPSFPNGNFFSADGLYPTAFGQAVLANEWIKVLNQYYSLSVPLISTRSVAILIKE